MKKESSHRSDELKSLGWNQEEIIRYEELFEYSQRWGLINLEREDRQFLKKAEKILPKIESKRTTVKKLVEEKSYYKFIKFYFDLIDDFDRSNVLTEYISAWSIILGVELELLKELKPVLGLPDTIKAKEISSHRSSLIDMAIKKYKAINNNKTFNFNSALSIQDEVVSKSWKSIIETFPNENKRYIVIEEKVKDDFKNEVHLQIESFMKNEFPSLKVDL